MNFREEKKIKVNCEENQKKLHWHSAMELTKKIRTVFFFHSVTQAVSFTFIILIQVHTGFLLRFEYLKHLIDCKTVGFFLKISKEIGKAWRESLTRAKRASQRLSPVSLSVFSLVPHLLFDCSHVLEYAKIRTVLQSKHLKVFKAIRLWRGYERIQAKYYVTFSSFSYERLFRISLKNKTTISSNS